MSGLTHFGSEAATQLKNWQNARRKLTFSEALPDGGSGARLALVYHEGDDEHQHHKLLLKLCAEDEGAVTEPGDLDAAWTSGPAFHQGARDYDFPRRRLIRQVYPPIAVGSTWLMFLQVALDERARHPLSPLSAVQEPREKAEVAAAVIRSILTEWNPDPGADHDLSAQAFLAKALGHRTDRDGRLARTCAQLLGPELRKARVKPPGWPDSLPNPTPFADESPLAGLKPPTVALGRAHYDLHPGNIMVATRPPVPDSFRLVDLSRFQERGLLVRDPVHLMLCLVCDHLPELGERARDELTEVLLDPDEDATDLHQTLLPGVLLSTLRLLRTAPEPWRVARAYAHPDWHPQYLLALQACALMFVTRRADTDEQLWFLRLAAGACAAFKDVAAPLPRPRHPSPSPVPGAAGEPAVPHRATERLPAELHAVLSGYESQLEHVRKRCADSRFDSALADNLRMAVNRCQRLAALAVDNPKTEATLAFHQQCVEVMRFAGALRTAHGRPGEQRECEAARRSFVAALARLLEHPGRQFPHAESVPQSSGGDLVARRRGADAVVVTVTSVARPPGGREAITVNDAKQVLPAETVPDIDEPAPTTDEPPAAT